MTCKASGIPEPEIIWKREDGRKIVLKRKKKEGKRGIENAYIKPTSDKKGCRKNVSNFGLKFFALIFQDGAI